MSTSEVFLSEQEISDFVKEFYKDCDYIYGYEQEEFGICPYVTFYISFQNESIEQIGNKIIEIYEEFENSIIDKPFKLRYQSDPSDWKDAIKTKKNKQQLIEIMRTSLYQHLVCFIGATTANSNLQSPRWGFKGSLQETNTMYSQVKLNFGDKWYRSNQSIWNSFVNKCLVKLNPIQAYSGYEIGNVGQFSFISPEFETVERTFSNYFYGLDIDHQNMDFSHENMFVEEDRDALGGGIRTPTWCFLLSPYWLDKLGLSEEEIRAKLNDPRIEITKIIDTENSEKYSLWIRLGELSLYPIEEGVPDLLVMANELIKPIRCDNLKLTTLDAWDDDPNPRFDAVSSKQWIARFDSDSTWPELKRVEQKEHLEEKVEIVAAGGKCPYAGYWFTVAKVHSRQYFKEGDIFPDFESDWGDVYWQFDGEE